LELFSNRSDFLTNSWKGLGTGVRRYWVIYGGYRALLGSPYLHIALAISGICIWLWAKNEHSEYIAKASDIAISAIPNLLGFTVGAFAIVLAFSSAEIFKTLAEEGEPQSFFMKLTANLVHFILIQVIALVSGIVAKITDYRALDVLTLVFLLYAILATFSAALQLFQTAMIYNATASLKSHDKDETQE
jgi:Co/Zn/Cd efflux system component